MTSALPLRVGIAGCGLIAGGPVREGRPILGNHAAACRAVEGVRLVAAADPSAERREAFGKYWEVPGTFATVEAMLEAHPLDLLIVATPHEAHEEACMSALRHGVRGILCEKPFTGSGTSAQRVVDACRARGAALVVNFMRRWDDSHRALAARVAAGEIGSIREVFASYTGSMRGNGAHFIDTLHMLVPGAWRVTWTSAIATDKSIGEDDGAIEAVLSCGDARAFVAPIRDAEYFVFEIHLLGTKGRARLMFQGNDLRIDLPTPHEGFPGYLYLDEASRLPPMTIAGAFPNALRALVAAVRDGREPDVTPEAYVASLSVVDSIVQYAKSAEK